MPPKGKTKAKGKGKGNEKQRARADPSSPLLIPALAQSIGPVHPPTSEVVFTLEHSLELVKTVVTATMLEILWNRRVFPEANWQLYAWDPADPRITYESFVEGIEGKNRSNFELTDNLIVWHFPKRGTTPGLDKILTCLESGAQDALEKGHLYKLNLSFAFVDDGPVTEANLIESYTMLFSYESGNVISRIYSEPREMQSPVTGPIVLLDAKNGARELVDNVGVYLWNSSKHGELKGYPLPPYYRMIMAMDYYEDTPSDYQAPHFHPGGENISHLLNLGHFSGNFMMKTGFHSVSVGWHLPGAVEQSAQVTQTREHLDNKDSSDPRGIACRAQRPSTKATRARQPSTRSEIDGGHTQPEAMKQIGGMGASRYPNTETQDTRPLYSPSLPVSHNSAENHHVKLPESRTRLPPYTQSIIDLLNNQDIANKPEMVNCGCGCGTSDKTGNLIKCLKCGSFQHVQCHGYLDDTYPTNVMCYWCLLHPDDGPDEVELYEEMQHFCVFRRILHYLLKYGPKGDLHRLAMHINRTPKETQEFLAPLQQDGIIQVEHSLPDEERCLIFYTLVGNEEKIRSNYFRPQQKISHHFAVPETPYSAQESIDPNIPFDRQSTRLTTQNLSDSQKFTQNAQRLRLLAEASSTQDKLSNRSNSCSSSRTYDAVDLSLARGSSSKKRAADSIIDSGFPKRRLPDVNSPWIRDRRFDAME